VILATRWNAGGEFDWSGMGKIAVIVGYCCCATSGATTSTLDEFPVIEDIVHSTT
jgi:hypothetical protein